MDNIKDFLVPNVFFNNIFIIFLIRLAILVVVLRLSHYALNLFAKGITLKITDKEDIKQINTVILTIKSVIDITLTLIFVMEFLTKIGVNIGPILTAAGVLGVAVGFGAKRFIEDIISGIILILEGQIRVGDYIEIANKAGVVEKLNLKMVVLRDAEGRVHYIRNGMIDIVTNYTRDYAYALCEIGVSYKENIDKVTQTICDVAKTELCKSQYAEHILDELEMLGISSFGESSVYIKCRVKTKPMRQWEVQRELNRLIKNKFDENGIEMPASAKTLCIIEDKK